MPRLRTRILALPLAAALGLGVVVGTGTITTRANAAPTSATAQEEDVAKDAVAFHKAFPPLWNAEDYDAIREYYLDDSILAPPNHDIIKGGDAIVAYLETLRPLLGEVQGPFEPHSVVKEGKLTTIMGNYVFENSLRVTSVEVYERGADGKYKCKQEGFGLRDPL